ncbi:MAG: DUF805 domain-containing protein [Thiotrichales bacterium]|nr:MAG: DUF805 domain-containing protein [Thiotrichales bacterium]
MIRDFFKNLLSLEGRLNRIGFLHSFVLILCLFVLLSIINHEYIRRTDSALTVYLYVKSLQSILLLALWTPSIIKRLHDIGFRGNYVWIAWVALLMDAHNLMLLNIHIAAFLQKIQLIMFVFYALVLIYYVFLFLMPGSRDVNEWGEPQEF